MRLDIIQWAHDKSICDNDEGYTFAGDAVILSFLAQGGRQTLTQADRCIMLPVGYFKLVIAYLVLSSCFVPFTLLDFKWFDKRVFKIT